MAILLHVTLLLFLLVSSGCAHITTVDVPPLPASADKSCVVSGCNSEICGEAPRMSVCVYRPTDACYRNTSVCERDASGRCGWRMTDALAACQQPSK